MTKEAPSAWQIAEKAVFDDKRPTLPAKEQQSLPDISSGRLQLQKNSYGLCGFQNRPICRVRLGLIGPNKEQVLFTANHNANVGILRSSQKQSERILSKILSKRKHTKPHAFNVAVFTSYKALRTAPLKHIPNAIRTNGQTLWRDTSVTHCAGPRRKIF